MKKSILFLLATFMFCSYCHAEIIHYKDNLVAFDYDDEQKQNIMCSVYPDNNIIQYNISTSMTKSEPFISCSINMTEGNDAIATQYQKQEEVTTTANGITQVGRIIAKHDNQYISVSLHYPSDVSDPGYCKEIYDSVCASECFIDNGADFETIEEGIVFENLAFSDLAQELIKQAIKICDSYLDMSLNGDDAATRIRSVQSSFKNLETDYIYDNNIYYKIYSADYYFESNNNGNIVEIKSELENLLRD